MANSQHGVHLVATTVGFSSLALLWIGLVLGMVLRDGWAVDRVRPATLAALHRTAVSCGLTLVVVHALSQLAIPASRTGLLDVFIPFVHATHPVGVGVGVLGMELMIAVAGSVALRRMAGYHRWRVVHRMGYVAFILVLAHVFAMSVGRYSVLVLGPIVAVGVGTVAVGLATAGWVSRLPRHVQDLIAGGRWSRRVAVYVDATRCVHFGFCQHEAPQLFELRADGRLEYAPSAKPDQLEAAIRAARACPTRAIMLSRQVGRVVLAEPPQEQDKEQDGSPDMAGDGSSRAEGDGSPCQPRQGAESGGGDAEHVIA